MAESPLSPSALMVPEVNKKFIQYRNVLYGTNPFPMDLDAAGDELTAAIRDATLAAHTATLAGMTPEAVMAKAADKARWSLRYAVLTEDGDPRRLTLDDMPRIAEDAIRAALPVLLGPEVEKREAAEWNAVKSAERQVAAEAERDRMREALGAIQTEATGVTLANLKHTLFDRLRNVRNIARAALGGTNG